LKKTLENFGIGIDIVKIDRFSKKNYKKNKNFYKKIFTNSEIDYCLKFKDPYPHFAGKFGVKESVIKSVHDKITFQDVSSSNSNNRPVVKLTRNMSKKYSFLVSITHEREYAVAVVISYKL
jgi:holo-[acyl-carrier protein] synthase|tara:strand:- start:116 stop:478 length:363 start_codon:yes stop_codon:yes gene_type:complete